MERTAGKITKVFDLHCDTLSECARYGYGLKNTQLQFSLDRLPENWRLCQAMAIFMPERLRGPEAEAYFDQVYQVYLAQVERYRGQVLPVEDAAGVDRLLEEAQFALMLTVEGGSALGGRLQAVDKLYRCGVKMMTLTWNGQNEICAGNEAKGGFTPFGRQVVDRMEELGMAVDASHLNDRSFYELCEFARKPFAASHSNARAVYGHPRNLTDDMFRIIVERGGIVGLNYYDQFIAKDGKTRQVSDLLRHVHHFLSLGGENTLALGSDFDGADMPPYLDSLSQVPYLAEAMVRSGIPEGVLNNILYDNARRFFAGRNGRK